MHDETDSRRRRAPARGTGTRRDLLRKGGVVAAFGIVGGLARSLRAEPPDVPKAPNARSGPLDVDAMARLLEDTPRERVFEAAAGALRAGTTAPVFEGAILLASVRRVDPRDGQTGLHCIFALNAARVLGTSMPREDETLPLFWALDSFKRSQESDASWDLAGRRPRSVASIPRERAEAELDVAAKDGDADRAVAAVVGLWQGGASTSDVFETLWAHGARDLDTFGHRAIYVANLRRTLDLIGADRATPALESLTAALFDGVRVGASGLVPGESVERAAEVLARLPAGWDGARGEAAKTRDLAGSMLAGDSSAARDAAAAALFDGGLRAQDAWDAVHVAAGCVVMDHPAIRDVHAVTATNALHYGFRASREPRTRLLLLLTAVGWTADFAGRRRARSTAAEFLDLAGERSATDGPDAAAEILDAVSTDRRRAARLAFALAGRGDQGVADFVREASRVVVAKGDNAHEYKFPVAAFENYALSSPRWRPNVLGAATSYLRSTRYPESETMLRARAALRRG